MQRLAPSTRALLATTIIVAAATAAVAQDGALPPVPVPAENPITEAKRVLGKMLFFEEQLSSDDTVSCATCHVMSFAGGDPRRQPNPGLDGLFGSPDDVLGSPGVVAMGDDESYSPAAAFGLRVQVTPRAAQPAINAMYAPELFWDGRAASEFVDPETGLTVIAQGGALENQALGPLQNSVEMAHAERDWPEITAKLVSAVPLGLADQLPPDVAAALTGEPGYPALFEDAFGDEAITATRIAMAIATYERTLVADQTDWDRFQGGQQNALTPQEARGFQELNRHVCLDCHRAPLFTDHSFRALGLRPPAEDRGRANVTGLDADRGKFKVPTLRNVALKASFFHNGVRTTLEDVLRFYARAPGTVQFPENQDPLMAQTLMPPRDQQDIIAFLRGGLVDPRVAAQTFPFDRPRLNGERAERRAQLAAPGRPGQDGVPEMVGVVPSFAGNDRFRVGISRGRVGAQAVLAVSRSVPVAGQVAQDELIGPFTLADGEGGGHATAWYSLADVSAGTDVYMQWRIDDGAATGGTALSVAVRVRAFAVRGEDEGPPVEPPVEPDVVVDDASLYVKSSKFTIRWNAHAAGNPQDRLRVRGMLNARGAGTDLSGALVSLTVGGEQVLAPIALDAGGKAKARTIGQPAIDVALDANDGRFSVKIAKADLRTAFEIEDTATNGVAAVPVVLTVQGAGLATETATGSLVFSYRTRAGKASIGKSRFAAHGTSSGVLRPTSVRVTPRIGGDRVRLDAACALPDGSGASLADGLVIQLGDAPAIRIEADALLAGRGGVVRFVGVDARLESLRLDLERGSLDLVASPVATGLRDPLLAETDELAFRLVFGTPYDPVAPALDTIVEVRSKRSSWRF